MLDVVLVHAFPFDGRLWDPQRESVPAGVRLHTPDLPGYGANREEPAETVDAMADAVHAFVDREGLRSFVLGGCSMGGYVTLAYWRKFAGERRIRGLVLVDTRAEADTDEGRRNRDLILAQLSTGDAKPVIDAQLPKMLLAPADPVHVRRVRALMEAQPVATIAAGTRALRDRPDATPVLATIDVPTLVICGAEDPITPPSIMRPMAERIRGARYVEIPDAAHLTNVQQPAVFDEAFGGFLAALT